MMRYNSFNRTLSTLRYGLILSVLLFCATISSADNFQDGNISVSAQLKLKIALSYLEANQLERAHHLPENFNLSGIFDEVPLIYKNRDGSQRVTLLNTRSNALLDTARSLLWRKDKIAMRHAYAVIYHLLPKKFRKAMVKPSTIKNLSAKGIRDQVANLARTLDKQFSKIVVTINPARLGLAAANPIGDCSTETGYYYSGTSGELPTHCELPDYASDGLFLQMAFPLRDKLTCIKDQGRRGTCTAHAVAAWLETTARVQGFPPENLSEQDIYYHSEVYGDSTVSIFEMQNYGSAIHIALDQYAHRHFGIYYENQWPYNRALNMQPMVYIAQNGLFSHPNSCSSPYYGGDCSDFTWQTAASTSNFSIPVPSSPPTNGDTIVHTIFENVEFPGIGSGTVGADFSLQSAIVLLSSSVPVIASMDITDNFSSSGSPYVRYSSSDPVRGGHSILMVGFVPNSELPSNVQPATERGYFIIKNSWGKDAGDCGFYYLDYRYVLAHLYYLNVLSM